MKGAIEEFKEKEKQNGELIKKLMGKDEEIKRLKSENKKLQEIRNDGMGNKEN
jgi:hypothetical protein